MKAKVDCGLESCGSNVMEDSTKESELYQASSHVHYTSDLVISILNYLSRLWLPFAFVCCREGVIGPRLETRQPQAENILALTSSNENFRRQQLHHP